MLPIEGNPLEKILKKNPNLLYSDLPPSRAILMPWPATWKERKETLSLTYTSEVHKHEQISRLFFYFSIFFPERFEGISEYLHLELFIYTSWSRCTFFCPGRPSPFDYSFRSCLGLKAFYSPSVSFINSFSPLPFHLSL